MCFSMSFSILQLIKFRLLLLQSCITKICIFKQKGNSVHSKAQAGEKCSERQPIHLLVLGVTALCFGALSEICWRVQSGRVGVCNAITARWAEGGSLEGLTAPKPGSFWFFFFFCHQVRSTLTAIPTLEPPPTSSKKPCKAAGEC